MTMRYSIRQLLALLMLAAAQDSESQSPTLITLTPTTLPSVGEPGVTNVSVTGSNFPAGAISAANVAVTLTPRSGGATTKVAASALATVAGTTRRVSFTIPASVSVAAPTPYNVAIFGTTSTNAAFASSNTAALTINPAATIVSVTPRSGPVGQSLTVVVAGKYSNFVQGSTAANFGAGVTTASTTVSDATHVSVNLVIAVAAALGPRDVTLTTGTEVATLSNGFTVTLANGPPTISDFTPKTASIGSVVSIYGTHLAQLPGGMPTVTLNQQGGGTVLATVLSANSGSLSFAVPTNAVTGPIALSVGGQNLSTNLPLTIVGEIFGLSASPGAVSLIQGQSVTLAVQLSSTSEFSGFVQLAATGIPSGITAAFKPASITAGQVSALTLIAPPSQPPGPATIGVKGSARVNGQLLAESTTAQITVQLPTTAFVGRTVVSDASETPLAGVTISMLGKDGNGNQTACSGSGVSDQAGNFALTNLPAMCVGPQLVGFNGLTATSPAGKYAGVNLVYTILAGQVTASPVLVHLPRIDSLETLSVKQNAASDQSYAYSTIPGLAVTVYAHTLFTMPDGSQPDPFPLIAVSVPVDRLPDLKPPVPTMLNVFIVAFQPANVTANQPVAVYYPNILNTPSGANLPLLTLDPTRGKMVPYGTGTVAADATQVVPDPDPAHAGHRYGIVHFDWHGPMPTPPPQANPAPPDTGPGGTTYPGGLAGPGGNQPLPISVPIFPCDPTCGCIGGPATLAESSPATAGDPVDLSSGIQTIKNLDIAFSGSHGGLALLRVYRSLTTATGPFGVGTSHSYNYALDTAFPTLASTINLLLPDGNRFPFFVGALCPLLPGTACSAQRNLTVPALQGAVMTVNSDNTVNLRWKNGTVWHFAPANLQLGSFLASITDANGNTTTLARNPADPLQLTTITDPVGRSLVLTYDSSDRILSILDPAGRQVSYTYNAQGTLATFTDVTGGITKYSYDSKNNMIGLTDPRGILQFTNTLDSQGRVIQQGGPDGGVLMFSYVFANPLAISPALQAQATDGQGVQATYRFDVNGFVTDVTSTQGETQHIIRNPGTHLRSGAILANASTAYTYDFNGNVLSQTDPTGRTTLFTYDPIFNQVTSVTDPGGNTSHFVYDNHGNLIKSTDANGNSTLFQYDSTGLLLQMTDAAQQVTKYAYDSLGNLASLTDPLGHTTAYTSDILSRTVLTVDAIGRRTSFAYDAMGRLLKQKNPNGGVTTLAYDLDGNLQSVQDARGNATAFTYDVMNRLSSRTDALGKSDARTYDTNGNLVKFVDRRGIESTYTYDSLNRLVSETYPDSAVVRAYDTYGRLAQVNDSAAGLFTFARDLAGRVIGSTTPFGSVTYAYDSRGTMVSRQVSGQPAVTYQYDAGANLTNAALPQAAATFSYDSRNLLSKIRRQNGVSTSYNYDANRELLGITHSKGSSIVDKEAYEYDPVGNRASHTGSIAQALATQPTTNQYNPANQLTFFGSIPNRYDANGNLVQEGTTVAYTWDARNRLGSIVTAAGQTTKFIYDYAGNLIQQIDNGTGLNLTKTFVLDSLTNVAYETASDGTSYDVLSGQSIDSHLAIALSNGQVQYGLTDGVNSTVATVDQGATIGSQFLYEPFGQTTTTGTYPFQFAGRRPVSNALYYNRARFYNTQTGRFISEDPIGFSGGNSNLYQYVANAPTGLTDPLGLFPFPPPSVVFNTGPSLRLPSPALSQRQTTSWQPNSPEQEWVQQYYGSFIARYYSHFSFASPTGAIGNTAGWLWKGASGSPWLVLPSVGIEAFATTIDLQARAQCGGFQSQRFQPWADPNSFMFGYGNPQSIYQ